MLGDELKNAEPLKDFDVPSERILVPEPPRQSVGLSVRHSTGQIW